MRLRSASPPPTRPLFSDTDLFHPLVMPQAKEMIQDDLEAMFQGMNGMTLKRGSVKSSNCQTSSPSWTTWLSSLRPAATTSR